MSKIFLTALAALGCAMPLLAAGGGSRVGWDNLVFTLEDLLLEDGIGASLTATSREWCDGSPQGSVICESGPVDPDFRLPSSGSTSNTMMPLDEMHDRTDVVLSDRLDFDLSPNTRLTVSGFLFSESSAPEEAFQYLGYDEVLGLDVYLHGFASAAGMADIRMGDGSRREVKSADAERSEATFSLSMSSNAQTLSSFVELNLDAITFAHQEIIAVPEPSSYVLLLSGLGVVGLIARRKARRRGVEPFHVVEHA
jgi:hypothetical protein